MDLNKATIIGHLTRDPEAKTTPSGLNVTTFGVATNLVWTDPSGEKQKKVEYHNIVAWRKLGDVCAQYLHKGSKIYLEGRLQTREWEGQDGVKRHRTEIVAENMIMLDNKGSGGGQHPSAPASGGDFSQPEAPSHEAEIQV
ncbi:MAG: hypothetical protein A3B15_02385, partial [Candidatus Buchananbacteria bacterium RIFCSPLOWO2_01_FULL_45_31]